jgi:bifunctional oligoribonuclease and PAP phosphatase NrnA
MHAIATQIHQHFKKARFIIIIPHQNPDGDALGAATALYEHLLQQQKTVHIFCFTPLPPKRWDFLHHAPRVTSDPTIFKHPAADTVVVVDSGDLRYAGVDSFLKDHPATIINIDHHPTNEHFGHLNLVIPTAASTTEVIYRLFKVNHTSINQKMATSLLTGLITDTDSFSNAATSPEMMTAASDLIRHGGSLQTVTAATIKNKSLDTLRLWGTVLSRLKKHEPLELAYTYVTQADLAEHGLNDNESEGIANFLNHLEDSKIALILKETTDGRIKGSFRTTHDDIDVTILAKRLGGGGHKKAAGFTADGTIEAVLDRILTA